MKANEITLNRFLAQPDTQFIIPVYQRNYDWSLNECKQLLNDILEVGSNTKINAHFIGSIVYIHDDIYSASGIRELTIIDGQQRLTTFTLIFIVLYKLAIKMSNKALENRINETYLINKFAETEKLKLRPTENNDRALKYLLRNNQDEEFKNFSRLLENYNYLNSRISEENYEVLLQGLNKIMFVEISLDRDKDEPQRIFESLNSTGLELSQADLIRNYILMGLDRKNQLKIYDEYWEIIEKLTKDETLNINKISDFIRDYLTLINKKIPNKDKVYQEFKNKYNSKKTDDLQKTLSEIKKYAKHYNKLLNPKNELDKDIKLHLEYINNLEINVSYPFLLKVFEDYSNNVIKKNVLIEILELLQSFVWRRFIVGLPTNALNKIFMRLYDDVEKNNYLISVQKSLLKRKGSQKFPRDIEVQNSLKEKDVYNIKPKNRIYFFQRLENFQNNEYVVIENNPDITIEHIFPQNPDPKWKLELGDEKYNFIKENYLNTISNLTLSGNNGRLGNKPFLDKKNLNIDGKEQGYKYSRLWLNKFLSTIDKWNIENIEKRFDIISKRFLDIWRIPEIELEEIDFNEINIFDADDPTGKKLEYVIFFDQKLNIIEVSKLYMHVFKTLFETQPQTFFTSGLDEKIFLTKNPCLLRDAKPLNETYYIESNLDNRAKFEKIKTALTVFDIEDELLIKYNNS